MADAQVGIIVAQAVVNAETDHEQRVPQLEEVKANLGAVAQITVADGQYGTAQQLSEAEMRGYEVVVAPGSEQGRVKRGEYAAENFHYDAEHQQVICPQGERLKFEGMRKKGGARAAVRAYSFQVYRQCPVRELCCTGRKGRRIEVSPQRAARDRQREKRKDAGMRALLRQRKAIIEPCSRRSNKQWDSGAGRYGDWKTCARNGRCCARPSICKSYINTGGKPRGQRRNNLFCGILRCNHDPVRCGRDDA